jgi:hypothetical protein
LKYSKGGQVNFLCRRISPGERTLVHFAEVLEGRNERLKFFMEKYRRPRAVRSCKGAGGVKVSAFSNYNLRRNRVVGSNPTRVIGSFLNSHF